MEEEVLLCLSYEIPGEPTTFKPFIGGYNRIKPRYLFEESSEREVKKKLDKDITEQIEKESIYTTDKVLEDNNSFTKKRYDKTENNYLKTIEKDVKYFYKK
jgi:hypothetical protein